MRTIIYIDGFNLYYGCLKNTAYKWLDLKAAFEGLLSDRNQITAIKYFTARVKPKANNSSSPQEQQAYLRALESHIPEVEIHYGHFLQHTVRMANAAPPPNTVQVIKTEEKGSDVNLSVHLLNDAWLNAYDCAVVVTNDSDMAEAMNLVKQHHPKKVLGLVTPGSNNRNSPQYSRTSEQLKKHANFVKRLRPGLLSNSQLPVHIPGTTIRKPASWD